MAGASATGVLRLSIVTPRGAVVTAEVSEVTAPGVLGEFGVLPGHIPFLSAIRAGVLHYVAEGRSQLLAVGPGFVEVGVGDDLVVLTASAAKPDEIDLAAVTREEEAATAALDQLWSADHPGEHTHQTALQAWARAQRETVERTRSAGSH
jgi:F-type H+-transporting ATPase subunit epsilon